MSQQPNKQKQLSEMKIVECYNCLSPYPVPANAGCTICPTCGQKSCSA